MGYHTDSEELQTYNTIVTWCMDILEKGYVRFFDQEKNNETSTSRSHSLANVSRQISLCTKCDLCKSRTRAVPGIGVMDPLLLVVGEAPGYYEDQQGKPFVGESGKYLDAWLSSIGLSRRTNVYITNTVKCRPPHNRDPTPEETGTCNEYLLAQIAILKPKVILAVGRVAGNILTDNEEERLFVLRSNQYHFAGIPLLVTYHPSAVLRNKSELRRPVWEDLQKLQALITRHTSSS